MKRTTFFGVAVGMMLGLGFSLPRAGAAVAVGDQPKMAFRSADGSAVSLEQLKGKIVVVDFWATWCGPCMAEAPHMVQLNQKYAPEGMQLLGISLDRDAGAMIRVAKEKGLAWPQFMDGTGGTKFAPAWGVDSIPRTFIIGPDGKVLWTGHPGNIDAPLAQAFKEHPPVLVDPAVLASAKSAVDAAEASLKDGDAKAALASIAKVSPAARADKAFAARADAVRTSLETEADKMLAAVEPMIQSGQYVEAAGKLKELADGLGDLPTGAKAKKQLAALMSKPEVKADRAKADRAAKAEAAFEVAQKSKDDKKPEQAYAQFKAVAKEFVDTDPGQKAAEIVKDYEKDPAFVKGANESAASSKATSTLKLARSYVAAGRADSARKKYQEVIDAYPNTSFAAQATKELAGLGK